MYITNIPRVFTPSLLHQKQQSEAKTPALKFGDTFERQHRDQSPADLWKSPAWDFMDRFLDKLEQEPPNTEAASSPVDYQRFLETERQVIADRLPDNPQLSKIAFESLEYVVKHDVNPPASMNEPWLKLVSEHYKKHPTQDPRVALAILGKGLPFRPADSLGRAIQDSLIYAINRHTERDLPGVPALHQVDYEYVAKEFPKPAWEGVWTMGHYGTFCMNNQSGIKKWLASFHPLTVDINHTMDGFYQLTSKLPSEDLRNAADGSIDCIAHDDDYPANSIETIWDRLIAAYYEKHPEQKADQTQENDQRTFNSLTENLEHFRFGEDTEEDYLAQKIADTIKLSIQYALDKRRWEMATAEA